MDINGIHIPGWLVAVLCLCAVVGGTILGVRLIRGNQPPSEEDLES